MLKELEVGKERERTWDMDRERSKEKVDSLVKELEVKREKFDVGEEKERKWDVE